MNESEYLTQEKHNELKAELNSLVHVRRKEVAEQLLKKETLDAEEFEKIVGKRAAVVEAYVTFPSL